MRNVLPSGTFLTAELCFPADVPGAHNNDQGIADLVVDGRWF